MPDALPLDAVYRRRFANREARRGAVWNVLCRWFDRFIPADARILDIACGHGEFANHLPRRNRTLFAADINPDARSFLRPDVTFLQASAEAVDLPAGSLDVVFASNFFEHLPSAEALLDVLRNAARMLKINDCSQSGGGGRSLPFNRTSAGPARRFGIFSTTSCPSPCRASRRPAALLDCVSNAPSPVSCLTP